MGISESELLYDSEWDGALAVLVQRTYYRRQTANLFVRHVSEPEVPGQQCPAACWPDEEGPLSPSQPEYVPLESVQVGNWIFSFGAGPTEHPAGWGSYQVCSQTLARWKEVASNLDTQWAQDGPMANERWKTKWRALLHDFKEHPEDPVLFATKNASMTNGKGKTNLRALLGYDSKEDSLRFTTNFGFAFDIVYFFPRSMGYAMKEKPFFVVLAVALPILYGGVHLTAWNFEFPTATEHLLWKVACFFIIGTVPAIASTAAMIAPCFQKVIRLAERKGSVGLYKAFCMLVLVVYTYR